MHRVRKSNMTMSDESGASGRAGKSSAKKTKRIAKIHALKTPTSPQKNNINFGDFTFSDASKSIHKRN